MRGREYEQNIQPEYLRKIEQAYFTFFRQQNDYPCVVIDIGDMDFMHDEISYGNLVETIINGSYENGMNTVVF
jgi:deoxyadenosine/deoxycytidine kinase